jgi:hypothetical protein
LFTGVNREATKRCTGVAAGGFSVFRASTGRNPVNAVVRSDDEQSFGFVRIKQTGDLVFKMYSPDAKAFRSAVEDGKLEGKVTAKKNDHFNVHIRADSALAEKIFSTGTLEDWYDEELTQTFHCIKRFDASE